MGGQYGTKNIIKVIEMLAEGGNVAEKMLDSKGGTISKLSNLSSLFDEVMALTTLDANLLRNELKELDAADNAAILAAAKAKFDIDDDELEGKIEEGLDLIFELKEMGAKVMTYAKSLNAK